MSILSRKKGESTKTGDNIEIFVAKIKDDKMYLGISTPESMKICRTKLHLTVEDNKEASDRVDLFKVFQLSRSLKALRTEEGQKKEGESGTA